jgi:hypothetical protein
MHKLMSLYLFFLIGMIRPSETGIEKAKKNVADSVFSLLSTSNDQNKAIDTKSLTDAIERGLRHSGVSDKLRMGDFLEKHFKSIVGVGGCFLLLSGTSLIYSGYRVIKLNRKKLKKASSS